MNSFKFVAMNHQNHTCDMINRKSCKYKLTDTHKQLMLDVLSYYYSRPRTHYHHNLDCCSMKISQQTILSLALLQQNES